MFVIGERINGMFTDIGNAINTRDKKPVQDMALLQLKNGASALDINVGTRVAKADRPAVMHWLVEAVREVTNATLAIDTPSLEVMRVGIMEAAKKGPSIINSTTGQADKIEGFMKLAAEHNSGIIGLSIDEKGVAASADAKVEIGMRIIASAMEHGIATDSVYLDPIILPINCNQAAPGIVLETIRQFKMLSDPAPHVVVGLSNLSQGSLERHLINRTFLVMGICAGLDASIQDPMDDAMTDAMVTAELLLNKSIYSDSYLKAYRQR